MIQNQQTVALSEVCAGVCEPTIDENKCSAVSPHSVFRKADTGGEGGLSQDKVRKSEVCSTHAYDGLMLFCMN